MADFVQIQKQLIEPMQILEIGNPIDFRSAFHYLPGLDELI